MGKISKQELASYIDFECERKLFVDLGKDDPNWMNPIRKIKPLDRLRKGVQELVTNIGKEYEQIVYKSMNRLRTKFNSTADGKITQTLMKTDKMEELYQEVIDNGYLIVLEHGIKPPLSFYQGLFDSTKPASIENMECSPRIYPDILIFNPPVGDEELLADGSTVVISPDSNRVGSFRRNHDVFPESIA